MKKQRTITHQVDAVVIRELFCFEFLCPYCLEVGLDAEDAIHSLNDRVSHHRTGILCCPHCDETI